MEAPNAPLTAYFIPMLRLTYATDIHLDHADLAEQERFIGSLADAGGESILLCGDISTSRRIVADLERIADASPGPVRFVLGNHDHFGRSIATLRDEITALVERRPDIQWLPPAGVIALDDTTVLIGVDGWADGRHGNALTTPLRLNDDKLIAELASQPDRSHRLAAKRALADADAERLVTLIDRASEVARTIVVATHIPPFVEALPTRGHLATPDWWPLLVCGATGAVLQDAAVRFPDHRFLVLAGHSHVAADVRIADNLRVVTGAARNGKPVTQEIEVE